MNAKKLLLIKIGLVVLLIVATELILSARKPNTVEDVPAQTATVSEIAPVAAVPEAQPVDAAAVQPTTTPVITPKTVAPKTNTYEDALKAYGSQRIQFSACRGTPGSIVLTKGSKFMLDNRDAAAHTIMVGTSRYVVKGYSYAIATASVVGTINITCDGGGAASLNVQR